MPRPPRDPSKPPPKSGGGYKPINQWKPAPGVGWQHGEIPEPPEGLHDDTVEAWRLWFSSWWASYWTPDIVPTIALIAKLHDAAMHGVVIYDQRTGNPRTLDTGDIGKLTQLMDKTGMTPHGRKQLLWMEPTQEEPQPATPPVPDELQEKRAARSRKLA